MPDFFEQMCHVIAESGKKNGNFSPDPEVLKQFFSEMPVTQVPVPENVPAPTAAPAPVAVAAPTAAPTAAPVPRTPVPPSAAANPVTAVELPVFNTLDDIRAAVHNCCRCGLCRTRNNPVFGEGDPDARLMFIGEGPGADEDRQGRPFVGKAGMLLDKMIAAMQFTREEVYIANIVKCRPPDNRLPAPEEADLCIGYLKRQIELIRPEVIVLLGATAVKYLLNVTSGISRMRGRWLSYENIPVMATFHPAFLLRQESAKRETWNDLQQVMARFGKYHRPTGGGSR